MAAEREVTATPVLAPNEQILPDELPLDWPAESATVIDAFSQTGVLLPGLSNLTHHAEQSAQRIGKVRSNQVAVAFFDLSGSTAAKLKSGNVVGIRTAAAFTTFAARVAETYRGRVVKFMGDGLFCEFPDYLNACFAALNIRHGASEYLGVDATAGLTTGIAIHYRPDRRHLDLMGAVVDKAARIQSFAAPGQVLIDGSLYEQVRADLADHREIGISDKPMTREAKGIGVIDVFEIAVKAEWSLARHLAFPFQVMVGRPGAIEKAAMIAGAKSEIIEIGIGLTSFANYFRGEKPDSFRDPLRALVRGGVNLRCYALDSDYATGVDWLAEQGNPQYAETARRARTEILAERRNARKERYRGKVEYHSYHRVPEFWCLGVDVEDPIDGRMFFAPYLMGVERSEMPVTQVSRLNNPGLYEMYLRSVRAVRDVARQNDI